MLRLRLATHWVANAQYDKQKIFVVCLGFLWEFLFLMSKSNKIEVKIQIFYQICMNFQHFGMKFAYKGVAVLIFEA